MTTDPDPRRCTARSSRTGEPCQRWAVHGAQVCPAHGGTAPRLKARIERDKAEQEARQAVELWGGRRDVDPATALLELVGTKAAEIQFWRAAVHQIQQGDEPALTFGVTREKVGGDDRGTTSEAKPHVALTLLHAAERDLANYAAAALRAGVDARMIEIAEATAAQFRAVVETVLADSRLGITAERAVRDAVVADALRTLNPSNPRTQTNPSNQSTGDNS